MDPNYNKNGPWELLIKKYFLSEGLIFKNKCI